MTKKDYILIGSELRDELRALEGESRREIAPGIYRAVDLLCRVFAANNPAFKERRFRDFVAGKCGPNGGAR